MRGDRGAHLALVLDLAERHRDRAVATRTDGRRRRRPRDERVVV